MKRRLKHSKWAYYWDLVKDYTKDYSSEIMMALKFIFPFILVIMAAISMGQFAYFLVGIFELASILIITNIIYTRHEKWAYAFNCLALLVFNIQFFVLYYGGSFVTLVMLTNVDSLGALSGKLPLYIIGILVMLVMTFLPIMELEYPFEHAKMLSVVVILDLIFTLFAGNGYSAAFGVFDIFQQYAENRQMLQKIADQDNVAETFYQAGIQSAIDKPANLTQNPNVIVIFVEGLSQNVIDDEQNIMPNVAKFQEQSLSFKNYYNHTFATYRGLIGQLFSGYQLDNYDKNNLVSMQSILASQGYQTSFVNTEPENTQFTSYLENLGYNEVISDTSKTSGSENTLSDKEAFDKLFEVASQQESTGQPFFTTMYTFGTHMSLDSTDEKYGDGKSAFLNKFYNFDYQFNEFMKKFNNSSLSDNTVIVFTTDHSTYTDNDYSEAFPSYTRENGDVDQVPFFIYYKGITPQEIDVQGRNSLDMVPTVLDYLDISEENYFLGVSLFMPKENNNNYDTVFHDNSNLLSTDGASISALTASQQEIIENQLTKYFAAKLEVVR
ncbi:LTA synthase family protein [Streptococcus loxodontisalivarius]|uniref:Sulfatase N-terminal domain-containing protein n=1 Tax=Streptococcus loxodontisalivarius TaxID=1349415 RepID=A0ABS2PQV7_9STRE|nr:sulfatase-like hydrolase/transferase [Streptococcus loxodontisalivarius]MBM7642429.1 hypothetical protein [Streptococcus loxodontisalivarius]